MDNKIRKKIVFSSVIVVFMLLTLVLCPLFVIGASAPVAELGTDPIDYYNSSSPNITFNLKCYDDLGVDYLDLYGNIGIFGFGAMAINDSPINNTIWSYNITDIPDGTYLWGAWCNDTDGIGDWAEINRTVTVDTHAPAPSQGTNPVDNYNDSDGSITFDFKCLDNLFNSTIQLWTNTTGTWSANYSNSSYTNNTWLNITVTGIPEGTNYKWAVWCNDSAGNSNFSENRTFAIDAISPTFSSNSTDGTYAGESINHRLYWQDNNALAGYIFSFDNGGGSFVNNSWQSMTGMAAWSNVTETSNSTVGTTIQWMVYANDSAGNWNASEIYSYNTTQKPSNHPGGGGSRGGGGPSQNQSNQTANLTNIGVLNSNGTFVNMTVNSSIQFNVKNEMHTLKLLELSAFKIKVLISSSPFYVNISANEIKEIDVNSDGLNDTEIMFLGLTSNGKAMLNIRALISAGLCGDLVCNAVEAKGGCCYDCGCASGYECKDNLCIPLKIERDYTWLWIATAAVIAAIILFFVFSSIAKKRRGY